METTTNDNLFNVSQSFFSPDILQKISREIDQPIEETKVVMKSVVPTLGLWGSADNLVKWNSPEGLAWWSRTSCDCQWNGRG